MKLYEKISIYISTILIISIFIGGIIYSADRLAESIQLREILFWSSIMFLLIIQIHREIGKLFASHRKCEEVGK